MLSWEYFHKKVARYIWRPCSFGQGFFIEAVSQLLAFSCQRLEVTFASFALLAFFAILPKFIFPGVSQRRQRTQRTQRVNERKQKATTQYKLTKKPRKKFAPWPVLRRAGGWQQWAMQTGIASQETKRIRPLLLLFHIYKHHLILRPIPRKKRRRS